MPPAHFALALLAILSCSRPGQPRQVRSIGSDGKPAPLPKGIRRKPRKDISTGK